MYVLLIPQHRCVWEDAILVVIIYSSVIFLDIVRLVARVAIFRLLHLAHLARRILCQNMFGFFYLIDCLDRALVSSNQSTVFQLNLVFFQVALLYSSLFYFPCY